MPAVRIYLCATLASITFAGATIAWFVYSVVVEGQPLSAAEDITLDLLIAAAVLLPLVWLQREYRNRKQQEIDDGRRKLDTAISHMSQGLVMFDASQRIAVCNRRYIELYGVSPAIVKPGLTFRDLLIHRKESGCFFGEVDEHYNTVVAGIAEGKTSDKIYKTSNGRFVRIVNQPLEGGGWVATHEDVTERQQLLDARERSEKLVSQQKRHLDIALNSMPHGICTFDASGRIVLFNRRYSEMMGQTPQYLQGLSLLELFRQRSATGALLGDPNEIFSAIMTSVREGNTTVREMKRSDGIVLRVVDTPMEDGGWVATYEDVTEQRRAESERDRNRAFLDLIIDNVPSAIFVKSAVDRKYVLVNRAGERFWGTPRQAMIGKTAAEIFPKVEASRIETRDNVLLQSDTALFEERELLTPRGDLRQISSRRLTIRDKSNEAQYVLGVIDDVTERKAAEARIAQLAHYDALTNLPNRTLFRGQLEQKLLFVQRGTQLAVHYLDLDHFKSVNDTLGHTVGDELLKAVAERLRSCLRASDLIARLGGDEFAIVQTQLQAPKDAEVFARQLREAVTAIPYDLNGHQTTTDLSIGIALSPEDGTEVDELIKHADLALYAAKAEGRANYRYFEPQMNERNKQRRTLEIDLRSALSNEEFELHYQPIINLETGAVTGCEALLRWNHPKRGTILPFDFIPVAEEIGLISAIGEWVLRTACAEARNWPDYVSVAVNISPVQFRNQGIAMLVARSLATSGLAAHRLELEVTESVLMQKNEATLAALHQIRDLGVRICMDDFGTGYSSLSYLRSFPFNKIKIDRSFITGMSEGDDAVAIVHTIIDLANSLKMTTTAEGVETKQQQMLLQAAGCDEMQGSLFSPPRPTGKIAELFGSLCSPIRVA